MKVAVVGKNSQLGRELQIISQHDNDVRWTYHGKEEIDITNEKSVEVILLRERPDVVVNCSAYTNVDQAEKEWSEAYALNVLGPKNLISLINRIGAKLIHISTDFVFDGNSSIPYKENSATGPVNVYGITKLEGEQQVSNVAGEYIILRLSWLYSKFGNNFVKTILRLAKEKDELRVVMDQVGSPTAASDVAEVIKLLIHDGNTPSGIYHYSNEGVASWYDFAHAILEFSCKKNTLYPIYSHQFPQLAKRPAYTVMDKSKIKAILNIKIPHWRNSLEGVLQ